MIHRDLAPMCLGTPESLSQLSKSLSLSFHVLCHRLGIIRPFAPYSSRNFTRLRSSPHLDGWSTIRAWCNHILPLGGITATVAYEELLLLGSQVRKPDIIGLSLLTNVESSRDGVVWCLAVVDDEAIVTVVYVRIFRHVSFHVERGGGWLLFRRVRIRIRRRS